jgi:hypothetical protein
MVRNGHNVSICIWYEMVMVRGMAKWTSNFNEKSSIVRLINDSTFTLPMIKSRSDLESLHRLSADDMCYKRITVILYHKLA